jgi:DNA polymerase delta subunit 4
MWLADSDVSAEERILRQFDLNKKYGPCVGMTRTERWRRAEELGLSPPPAVLVLLQAQGANEKCLWEGRV